MPAHSVTTWLAFGSFLLDPKKRQLFRGQEPVKLRGKTMAVLCYLAEHSGVVVSREEILAAIWPNVTVQNETLATSIAELRKIFGDTRIGAKYIETRHGHGFRFIPDVRVIRGSALEPVTEGPAATRKFIGRESELSTLLKLLDSAWAGRAQFAIVWGSAGIGKTRLMDQFAAAATESGARVLWGRAAHTTEHSAFWMWTQIIRQFAESVSPMELRAALGSAAADIVMIAPSLQDRIPDLGRLPALDPSIAYTRFFDGLIRFFKQISARQPTILMLDDLHKASSSSLALLQAIASDMVDHRIVIVAAYRGAAEPDLPALSSALHTLRDHGAVQLPLAGMDAGDIRELIANNAAPDIKTAVVDKIVSDTGGNPYFVLEILSAVRDLDTAGQQSSGSYRVPDSVNRVLGDRLRHLDPETRNFLIAAAVAGSEFDAALVAAASGIGRDRLPQAVGEAVAAGFLVDSESGLGRLRFDHEILREKLLRDLPKLTRADLHDRIGDAIEQRDGATADVNELAYHFMRSASAEGQSKAIRYCLFAGNQALEHYSNQEALQLLERARELAQRSGPSADESLCQILERLAEAHVRLGNVSEADAATEQLHTLARALGNPTWLARAALAMSSRTYQPSRSKRGSRSAALLEHALSALPEDSSLLRARINARLAVTLLHEPDADERRIALVRQAIDIARRQPDPVTAATIIDESLFGLWDPDHKQEQRELAGYLRDVGAARDNLYFECQGAGWIILDLLSCGRLHQMDAEASRMESAVAALRVSAAERYLRRVQAHSLILRGNLQAAADIIESYQRLASPTDPIAAQLESMFLDFTLRREQGLIGDAALMVRSLAPMFPTLGLRHAMPYLLLEAGYREEAIADFEALAGDLHDLPPRNAACGWLPAVAALGDACVELNATARAAKIYEILSPYEEQWAVVFFAAGVFGSVGRVLGSLAAMLGEAARCEGHFRRVIRLCEEEEAITELARAKCDFARALDRLGHEEQDGSACRLRAEALELAQRYQLIATLRRIEASTSPAPT